MTELPAAELQPPGRPASRIVPSRPDLQIALVAALSALGGSLVGALSSYFISAHQVSAQADQARADFLRGQRQSVYAKLSADHGGMLNLELECDRAAKATIAAPNLPGVLSLQKRLSSQLDQMRLDNSTLFLVGSKNAAAAADNLVLGHNLVDSACVSPAVFITIDTRRRMQLAAYKDSLQVLGDGEKYLTGMQVLFREAARHDLSEG